MPRHCFRAFSLIVATTLSIGSAAPAIAGAAAGNATEWTQLLNNAELVTLVGQSGEQVRNQLTQIGQLAEQIQNQLRIYDNMLQNTAQLPEHIWSDVERDLTRLQGLVGQGEGIAFSMANADDILAQRFPSYGEMRDRLENGGDFSATYADWSQTNRDTIAGTLRAAGLTTEQFSSEEATMRQLRGMSETADGQMKALQIGHQIAAEQVGQVQKLRGLVAQQTTMMGTWFQSSEANRDLAQLRREQFFSAPARGVRGGQTMEPRW